MDTNECIEDKYVVKINLNTLCLQVSRHLTKLFDSLAKLELKGAKTSIGMYSKEGEYVKTESQTDLSGQVI